MKHFIAALLIGTAAMAFAADPTEIDGLKSTPPSKWVQEKAANAMRTAQFKVPKADGDKEDAEVTISYFGQGSGGGVAANVERWTKQFKGAKPKTEELKVGDVKATYFDATGTYLFKSRPFDPAAVAEEKPNTRMLAVVFESPKGPYFFRLVGPDKTVTAAKDDFDKWVKGFKKE